MPIAYITFKSLPGKRYAIEEAAQDPSLCGTEENAVACSFAAGGCHGPQGSEICVLSPKPVYFVEVPKE